MSATLRVAAIRTDGGTQSREAIRDDIVEAYVEAIESGDKFPPIVVFHDGENYWLGDGFHRVEAFTKAGVDILSADIRQGTRRDAVLHSVGANATHGLPRTNADKRRAVETLLRDEEWAKWSDREIARVCKVSPSTVGSSRKQLSKLDSSSAPRIGADGKVRKLPEKKPTQPKAEPQRATEPKAAPQRIADDFEDDEFGGDSADGFGGFDPILASNDIQDAIRDTVEEWPEGEPFLPLEHVLSTWLRRIAGKRKEAA